MGLRKRKHSKWVRKTVEWTVLVNIAMITTLVINSLFTFKLQAPLVVVHNQKAEVHAEVLPEPVKEMTLKEHVWHIMVDEYGLSFDEAQKGMTIVQCESKWNKEAEQYRNNTIGVDRGLFQINSYFHPEVSSSCAYDVYCNTRAAMKIYKANKSWDAWACNRIL